MTSMSDSRPGGQETDRSVSEVIGVLLLFGLVLAGATLVYMSGTGAQQRLTEDQQFEEARLSMQNLGARMGSLAHTQYNETESFTVGPPDMTPMEVENDDTLQITLNENPACRASMPVTEMTYRLDDGRNLTYQAGGIWQYSGENTTMVEPPTIAFENGSLSVEVTHVPDGELDNDFRLKNDAEASARKSRQLNEDLFDNSVCYRPDNATIRMTTDRPRVWAQYFSLTAPSSATVTQSGNQVTVEVPQDALPAATDDAKNTVVDFTNGNPNDGTVSGKEITVTKKTSRSYGASVELLHADIARTNTVVATKIGWNNTTVPEPYTVTETKCCKTVTKTVSVVDGNVDVALVLDDSGSMKGHKINQLKVASKAFVDEMGNGARVSIVRYDHHVSVVQHLSTNYPAAKARIQGLHAGGSTNILGAVQKADWELRTFRDPNHEQIMIFVTDGKCNVNHDCATRSVQTAAQARAHGITVHTVSVGSGPNVWMLQQMAHQGGGEYHHVNDASELHDLFQELTTIKVTTKKHYTVTKTKCCKPVWHNTSYTYPQVTGRYIVHNPARLQVTVGGTPETPWVGTGAPESNTINTPGDASGIEGMSVTDGETVEMQDLTVWSCNANASVGPTVTAPNQASLMNSSVPFVHSRCTSAGSTYGSTSNAHLFVDGQTVPSSSTEWFQTDLENALPSKYVDTTGAGPDTFDLDKNQVIVVYEFSDHGVNDKNNAIFLYEMGNAPGDTKTSWVVDVRVNELVVESD